MNIKLLNGIIIISKDGLIKISPEFVIKNIEQVNDLLKCLEKCFFEMSCLSKRGYVNDPKINIPFVYQLVKELGIKRCLKNIDLSILLNTLYYNLILLLFLNIIIIIEQWLKKNDTVVSIDLKVDLKCLKNNVTRMINPVILNRLKNKGLSILLNTTTGFDSEYELKSSLENTNNLLSIQLASNTSFYVKVPIICREPLNHSDFGIKDINKWGESILKSKCCKSIDEIIKLIRFNLYSDNDLLIDNLINKLKSLEEVRYFTMEDSMLFTFPKTAPETLIKYVNEYTSVELLKDSEGLNDIEHSKALLNFIDILNGVSGVEKEISPKMFSSLENSTKKPTSRISYRFGKSKLSITTNRILFICMHESPADLSILKDFEVFKEQLDIVGRSFVTRGRPLNFDYCKSKVHIRDTTLIAPGGAKSLAGIGNIYGDDFKKIDIGDYRNGRMSILLKDDKELFEKYAIRDSIITLKHATTMEEFNLTVGKIGVPLTISGIGKNYVLQEWSKSKYKGYQEHKDIMIGNITSKLTPKDARAIELSKYIVPFITGYRGGRNESFMYGIDYIDGSQRSWVDYDLTSAYTTVMSILGHPDTEKGVRIFNKTVQKMSVKDLLFNYIIVDVEFKFDKTTKYPCIPTRVDDNVDIYPLEGRSTITGCEYLVAKSMGCRLYVKDGVMIPFKTSNSNPHSKEDLDYQAPFRGIVKDLQHKRRKYPKKTFYNYMYKEIGNSIYGQVAMGISARKGFDIKSKSHVIIEGGVLSNPILASYITGFTRALVSECMHNIQLLNGKIVSVTTDGFITDVEDLESKILALGNENQHCLNLYRKVRKLLTTFDGEEKYNESGLEIKNVEEQGLISWKTRGQLGFTNGGISAATGFQLKYLDKQFIIDEFTKYLTSDETKFLEYIQTSLRSATDIYKYGGHVTVTYKDRKYGLYFDDKRRIIDQDPQIGLLDSLPWYSVNEYAKIRVLKETITTPVFTGGFTNQPRKSYKSYIETSVRSFIKACFSEIDKNRYGIPKGMFCSYKELIEFIYNYEPAREVKLTPSSISHLKNRNSIARAVPRTVENESFIEYVKQHIKSFDNDRFFRELSSEAIRNRKNGTI